MNMILRWLLGCWLLTAVAAEPAGEVVSLSGAASATAADGTTRQLSLGAPVYPQDTLLAAQGALLEIRLGDGSQLLVQDATRLTLADYLPEQPQGQIDMAYGNLRAIVGSTFSRRPNSFRVRTATATMGVQGTDFRVLATPTMTEVKVYSGVVAVVSSNPGIPQQQTLTACEGTAVELNQPPLTAAPFLEEALPPLPPIECTQVVLPTPAAALLLTPLLLKLLEDGNTDNRPLSPE